MYTVCVQVELDRHGEPNAPTDNSDVSCLSLPCTWHMQGGRDKLANKQWNSRESLLKHVATMLVVLDPGCVGRVSVC